MTYKMTMSEDLIKRERDFIRKERQRINNTNPEKEERKAFFQNLRSTHPDLADAVVQSPKRKRRR